MRQDRAGDDAEEVIGPRLERRLVAEPGQRSDQGEEIAVVHVGPGRTVGLGEAEEARARLLMATHDAWSANPGSSMAAAMALTTPR